MAAMMLSASTTVVLAVIVSLGGASQLAHKYANACSDKALEINGNWYCEPNSVQAVTYTGFQTDGQYSRVTSMEQGECSSEAQVFNSSLGSIGSGNDLSWHFRGPLQLDQFAYYTLSSSTEKKRNLRPSFHERRHGHNVVYKRQVAREKVMEIEKRHIVEIQKRAVCDPVTVTFNGVAVSWLNLWNGYSNVPSSVCYHTATTTAKASTKASSATSTQPTTVVTNGRTTTITYTVVYASTATSTVTGSHASSLRASLASASASRSQLTAAVSVSAQHTSSMKATSIVKSETSSPGGLSNSSSSANLLSTPSSRPSSTNIQATAVTPIAAGFTSTGSVSNSAKASSYASSSPSACAAQSSASSVIGSGIFDRQAYYNAATQNSVGFAFLNHNGGQGSGVWDSEFGNSLSYASRDAERGSATPQIFDGHLEDGVELVVMSDKECGSDDFCGFSRPGTVAHQGFDNSEALFLMEFSMPITNKTGWNMDTPAIWILNAQIPRTLQYGKAECSCWSSGCGEMDIFEVLDAANTRMKSTWHGDDDSGGSSYWFKRPQTSRKAGVLFSESNEAVTIFYLPDDVDFSSDIDATAIVEWIGSAASDGTLFTL